MILDERIELLEIFFNKLCSTNSIVEKKYIIDRIPSDLKDDFQCVVECLAGVHKFGYTYYKLNVLNKEEYLDQEQTVRDVINYLLEPARNGDLTMENIRMHLVYTSMYADFFEPIVNRTLKLGIGKSILPNDGLSAMLAKKYDGKLPYSKHGYFVTEKLDGNRCIARYDGTKWVFTSRNGKPMHVNFDMSNLPKEFVYDGEILSPAQSKQSSNIYQAIMESKRTACEVDTSFNTTSGLINRHSLDKKLVYNIFDVMIDNTPYYERRQLLESMQFGGDTQLVKVLHKSTIAESLQDVLPILLDNVTDMGGEGIMVNLGDRNYVHKRTDGLFKVKKVQTMDMRVDDIQWGQGKYEGQVGALICSCRTDDGKLVMCDVGTGLSDDQRLRWALNPKEILGKIVEIGYFSLSQDKSVIGTNCYSLRFPRLKGVRYDKNETSEN